MKFLVLFTLFFAPLFAQAKILEIQPHDIIILQDGLFIREGDHLLQIQMLEKKEDHLLVQATPGYCLQGHIRSCFSCGGCKGKKCIFYCNEFCMQYD